MRDLEAELNAGGMLPTWKPDTPGTTLTGVLAGYREQQTKYGPARLALIDPEDGGPRQQVFLTPTVLKAAWAEKNPQVGDRVAIRYNGKHPLKGYLLYAVAVERAAERFSSGPEEKAAPRQPYADAVVSGGRSAIAETSADADADDIFGARHSRTIQAGRGR